MFARQALAVQWNTAEAPPLGDVGLDGAVEWIARVIESQFIGQLGQVEAADALKNPLPSQSAGVWFTDPPYYDAVPYAELSDFFFVWLKRTLPGYPLLRDLGDPTNPLTPKAAEIVQDEVKEIDQSDRGLACITE